MKNCAAAAAETCGRKDSRKDRVVNSLKVKPASTARRFAAAKTASSITNVVRIEMIIYMLA